MRSIPSLWVLLIGLTATELAAQSSGIVLRMPSTARAAALGNAYVASGEEDASIFSNPGQLAGNAAAMAAGFSVQRHVEASHVAALSAGARVGIGYAAAGLQVLDFGSEAELVPDAEFGGQRGRQTGSRVGARDLVASVGYGVQLWALRAGASIKLVNQQVANLGGSTHAVDVGVAMQTPIGVVGAVMQNSGGLLHVGMTSANLPLTYRGGLALSPRRLGAATLAGFGEVSTVRDENMSWSSGVELLVPTSRGLTVAARGGLRAQQSGSLGSRVTLGGGIKASRFALDYAYQTLEGIELGTHRVGVRWWR